MQENITPIFIFSLPRSGSTLLQRVLAAHSAVGTAAEPWLLLPLVYSLKEEGMYTEYGQGSASKALVEFVGRLPGGSTDYHSVIRELSLKLYSALAAPGELYFVDKTPRYHLIIEEILEMFPHAKCLLLWRNPLSIAASMMKTWGNQRWELYRFNIDLYRGLENLERASRDHAERFHVLRYEDMVSAPHEVWRELFASLGLEFDPAILQKVGNVVIEGSMGDPDRDSRPISDASINRWPEQYCNPLRRIWAKRYLDWIGDARLAQMGYDRAKLLDSLPQTMDLSSVVSDSMRMTLGAIHAPLDLSGIRRQLTKLVKGERCYSST